MPNYGASDKPATAAQAEPWDSERWQGELKDFLEMADALLWFRLDRGSFANPEHMKQLMKAHASVEKARAAVQEAEEIERGDEDAAKAIDHARAKVASVTRPERGHRHDAWLRSDGQVVCVDCGELLDPAAWPAAKEMDR